MKKVIAAELAVEEVMTGLTSYSVRSKEVEGICHDLFEDSGLDIWSTSWQSSSSYSHFCSQALLPFI